MLQKAGHSSPLESQTLMLELVRSCGSILANSRLLCFTHNFYVHRHRRYRRYILHNICQ